MSEFKRGDKVVFEKDGKELIGVIHAVGNTLAGVEVGVAYLALAIEKLTIATPARIAGFEFAKSEQKVHMKTERLVQELQLGDLSRDQVMAVLDKVKAKF